ncbi:MAG: insulinase family protein [Bacteroidales bacterium]|nr:insulinase family protein [Bacteroidales bacterium]
MKPLPQDEKILSGTLGNGVAYYIVSNPSYMGMVDIALVQRAGRQDESQEHKGGSVVRSRAALTELPHFSAKSPFSFMRSNGLTPGRYGWTHVDSHSTIYRFDRLVVTRGTTAVDSTLLMVFDIVDRCSEDGNALYSTDNQAIIVSGDVDASAVLGKMNMLSLFVMGRPKGVRTLSYEWQDRKEAEVEVTPGESFVGVRYRSPRTAPGRMNSPVPLVMSRYAMQTNLLMQRRLSMALRHEGIACGDMSFDYSGSADSPGDELITMKVAVAPEDRSEAMRIMAGLLADLDRNGIDVEEYKDIRGALEAALNAGYGAQYTRNNRYMERCMSAFLYGSPLYSISSEYGFFAGRKISDEDAVGMFNTFIRALLDSSRNLTILVGEPSGEVDKELILNNFRKAWTPMHPKMPSSLKDSIFLRKGFAKAKVQSSLTEPMFGGQIWTFSNGIRVIYNQVPQKGFFRWKWLLKGGYSSLPGITDGEGAWLGDMLKLSAVSGMPADRFNSMLEANGINLESDISFSEFSLGGTAPDDKLQLLLKALSSLTTDSNTDMGAYNYWKQCEKLRVRGRSVFSILDSLMHKSMTYSPYKRPTELREDLPKRADMFFANAFSKMNDGVLIIVGGMPKEQVLNTLSEYMGSFHTERASTYRSRVRHGLREGRNVYRTSSVEPYFAMALSAPFDYNAINFMAATMAAFYISDRAASAVAPYGWAAESDWAIKMFPDESVDLLMGFHRADEDGLPASMVREDSTDVVLAKVRSVIDNVGRTGISSSELEVGKSLISHFYSFWTTDPETIINMLVLRYSYGKDLVTGYKGKIASITLDDVNRIVSMMAEGGSAELVSVRSRVPPVQEGEIPPIKMPYVSPMTWVKGAYPFDGSILPPEVQDPRTIGTVPTIDFGEDSSHIAWRDSVVLGRAVRALEGDIDRILETDEY